MERALAARFLEDEGWGGTYLWRSVWSVRTRLLGAEDRDGAAKILDEALARFPPDAIPDGEAPVLDLAIVSASLGRTREAEAFLERHRSATASFAGQ